MVSAFTLDMAAVSAWVGQIAVSAVHARDCDNQPGRRSGPEASFDLHLDDGVILRLYRRLRWVPLANPPAVRAPTVTWSLTSGTIPTGSRWTPTRNVSGTPATPQSSVLA